MKKRENNYDLLRVAGSIAVIMIHVSSTWFATIKDETYIDNKYVPLWICIYYSISRFAVPCFVMLSGAFILDYSPNMEYRNFYKKSYCKIGVPIIIFSLLYTIYHIPSCLSQGISGFKFLAMSILTGSPMYHMWYLYMLIGVYALAPVVLRFKNSISDKAFKRISVVFLVLAALSNWTGGNVRLYWDVGFAFEYLAYFMVGYSIRKTFNSKNNYKSICFILTGLMLELFAAGLVYGQTVSGSVKLENPIVGPYCPFIVSASLMLFIGFSLLDIKKDFDKLSRMTLWIYLIHAGIWDLIVKIFPHCYGCRITDLNAAVFIPFFVFSVFVTSYLLSHVYLWLWGKIDMGSRVTNFLVRIVRL